MRGSAGRLAVCVTCWVWAAAACGGPALEEGRDFVYVCRDAGGGYESCPSVCVLPDGRLLAVFYAGTGARTAAEPGFSQGGRIMAVYSEDGGKAWSAPVVAYDGPHDDLDPALTCLPETGLWCTLAPYTLGKQEATGARGAFLLQGGADGASWIGPRVVTSLCRVSAPVRALQDGGMAAALYSPPEVGYGAAVALENGGGWRTVRVGNGKPESMADSDLIALANGWWYYLCCDEKGSCRFSVSQDGGATWSGLFGAGFASMEVSLSRGSDGTLVCCGRQNELAEVRCSTDDALSWSEASPVDSLPSGKASATILDETSWLVLYTEYAEDEADIRARRFRLDSAGVSWAPFEGEETGAEP